MTTTKLPTAREIRRWLRESPGCVFATDRIGGKTHLIVAVKTVGGIVWVTPEIGCGSFMPASVKRILS